jgi:hypothetical protein
MKKLFLFIILFFTVALFSASAQSIQGIVVDAESNSLQFVNVLQLRNDSTFNSGCITDERGAFKMEKADSSNWLKLSFVGYKDKFIPILGGQTDFDTIIMERILVEVDEVSVYADLPTVYIKKDAQVTTIRNSILADEGAADDVLGKIPGINKSQGKLEVFGKGEPLIYINGRQVRDFSELEQLSSKDIDRIELITNPGARYDATVGAVVRIITNKNPQDGLGIDFYSTIRRSVNTDLRDYVQLNYRKNGWNLFATFDYNDTKSKQHSTIEQTNKVENNWAQQNTMTEDSRNARFSGVFEADYSFNTDHTVGVRYSSTFWAIMNDSIHINSAVKMNGAYYDQWESRQLLKHDYDIGHRVNTFYLGKVGNTSIDFNADYLSNGQTNYYSGIEYSSEWDDRIIESENPVKNRLLAGKLTFSTPLWGGEISYGSQASFTSRRDDYISHSEFVETSFTQIKDRSLAAFVEYSHMVPFSETVMGTFSVGCRYEHAAYNYYDQDQPIDGQSRKFNHVFPSASLSMQINTVQLMASYSAKTSRPSYRNLRNAVEYINRFTLQTGNPFLEPCLIHDYSLAASWKFFQCSIGFRDERNVIIEWAEPLDTDPSISVLKPQNFDRIPRLYFMFSAAPEIGVWHPRLSLGFNKQWFSVSSQTETIPLDKNSPFGVIDNTFVFPQSWKANLEFGCAGKGYMDNYFRSKNMWICNMYVQKTLLDNAMTITLGVNDLFNQSGYYFDTYYPTLRIYKSGTYDSREVYLTLRYRLNAKMSKYRGSLSGEEERQRF